MEQEIKLILKELQKMNGRLENLETGQKNLETGQKKLEMSQKGVEANLNQLQSDVRDIKAGQEKLQKNLIQSLGDYTEKMIQYTDDKTAALNKRVYALETEIEKLQRQ